MKLTFYGAARTVTGSRHLLEVNGTRILLDCGLVQGRRSESYSANVRLPFEAASIDLMILSHAHIDHSGNIPNLVKNGFRGDIICTPATRDLCATMLLDSAHIQERDVEFVNKKRRKKGEPPVEPIYTQEDALKALEYFISQGYGRRRQIAPGIHLTFKDAGHMLGSAITVLEIADADLGREYVFVFSGDLGQNGLPIIRDPELIERADVLILESTYGDREHGAMVGSEKRLEQIINETVKRGGSVIMPAFAVGRTQQIVVSLHRLYEQGDIPRMPIYVDSPLAVNTTGVFKLHPECYDEETRRFMLQPGNTDPFGFDMLTYIQSLEESKRLNFEHTPCIIISASGMAEFGRVLHHLKNRIEDERNTVLITGWQAPHTLGRRLVEKAPRVHIFGDEYPLRARVEVLDGFSGHADRSDLLHWVGAMQQRPRRTFLVHGELAPATALKQALHETYQMQVDIPEIGQQFSIETL
ncbi:MAG: MBL fold metallo-hydrolase [Anaerolineae bacterium]|jgi:metallo-beta-lactamase family protein|nr:MBL fold metallo-hydrolase [Anaerolineae bacterium]